MCRYLVTSRQHGASELQPWAAAAVASRAGPWVDTTPPQPAGSRSSSSWSSCSSWSPAPAAGSPGPSGGSRSCPGVRPRQTEVGLQCLHSAVTVIVLGQVTVTQHLTTWHCVVTSVIGIVTCDMWCVMCDVKIWWQGCSIWRKLENSVANIFVLHQVCSLKINNCFYSSRWDVMLFHYFGLHNFLVLY